MVSLLRELDPSLEIREVQKFMVDSFSDSAHVDCSSLSLGQGSLPAPFSTAQRGPDPIPGTEFLLLLWSGQQAK